METYPVGIEFCQKAKTDLFVCVCVCFDEGREDPINITPIFKLAIIKLRFTGGSIRLLAGWLCDFPGDSEQYCHGALKLCDFPGGRRVWTPVPL